MKVVRSALLAASLIALAGAAQAQVRDSGYVTDTRAAHVRAAGSCVRTGYWTPAMAVIECDPDLVPKPAAIPAPAPAAQPAPAPAPAPIAPAPAPKPKPAVAPVVERVTLSADVLFEFDRAVLRPEGRARLDQLVGSRSKSSSRAGTPTASAAPPTTSASRRGAPRT